MKINKSETLHTPFGNARISTNGYYQITSSKEGYCKQYLHRLIWEHFYKFKIPKGYFIHHKNGNKTDNCILNLQLIERGKHSIQHLTGRKHSKKSRKKMSQSLKGKTFSKEHKEKLSESHKGYKPSMEQRIKLCKSKNTTGYYRVNIKKDKTCKQGFAYRYEYTDENNIHHSITSVDIKKLEQKVKAKGLEWIKF